MQDSGFLVGDGEMRNLMRTFDWSQTPLGPIESWPQSLRTTVRTLLSSRYAMWMAWGPELTFFYNDTYGAVTLGKKHPWALGRPAQQVWQEIWQDLEPRIRSVFETGNATWDEGLMLMLERSGYPEETYHTFSYSPLADDSGTLAGMLCVVTEETVRVLGERQLASLRDLAAGLTRSKTESEVFAAVEECLGRSNRDLPFSLIYKIDETESEAVLAMTTGFEVEDSLLAPSRILLNDSERAWPVSEVLQWQSPIKIDLKRFPKAFPRGAWDESPEMALALPIAGRGEDRPAAVLIAGLNRYRALDEKYQGFLDLVAGQIAGGLGSALAYELERRRAESLAELDRAKTAFFSNVSHELRTPLTLLLGPLEAEVEKAEHSKETAEHLQLMQRNGTRLLKLVNTLLEFSRVESGRMQARFRPLNLREVTENLASTFRSAIEQSGLTLSVEGNIAEPVFIDPEMWEKIILNLISNAFKSTFQGGITVRLSSANKEAVVEVADTGTGIPESDISHLFERFHRVEGARRRTHEGSGIGLALVHELVRMNGGSIEVESQLHKGTTFRIRLPLGAAHLPKDQLADEAIRSIAKTNAYVVESEGWLPLSVATESEAHQAETMSVDPALRDATVLVVDDNRDMREYVSKLLQAHFKVEKAENGRQALQMLQDSRPDIVLSDVMMPEMDGFELLSSIRKDSSLREVPVILLSARAGEESRVEGMEAGADDYLVKPFTARELVARVTAHVSMTRVRRAAAEREREFLRQSEVERRRLEDLLMQAPAMICVLSGPEHRFTLANRRYRELVGWERGKQLEGKTLLEALPEIATQGFNELLDRVYTSGEPYLGSETPVELARGESGETETVFLNFVYQPWMSPLDETEGVFVHAVDVTESVLARKTVEDLASSVQEKEARLNAILRQVVSGIFQLDGHGSFSYFNERFCQLSGRTADELEQMTLFDLLDNESRFEMHSAMKHLFETGNAVELLQRWRHPNGTDIWVQQNLAGVYNENGDVESVLSVVQDVTAKKHAEEALRRSEKLAAVGQLASTIAHEINNPLEAVTNLLYLMNGAESLDEVQQYAHTASAELNRVSHVVTSTLQFHRKPLRLEREDIGSLLQSALSLYEARIRSSEIEVNLEMEDVPDVWCYGSELRQVFTNLIGNAFDATKNAPRRQLHIRLHKASPMDDGERIRITIADTGLGMDASTHGKIFDPFFTTKGIGGSGLGLWLSLDILKKHRATMKSRTRIGSGTVFTIWLPLDGPQ